jgi:ribose-phosphate pyrophosphokinase
VTVVAPDQGAEHRARSLATQLGGLPVATVIKTRDATGVKAHRLDGELTEQAIIVDDILDTGETLLAAARLLRDHGVKTLTIAVTHSLLTGESWQKLWPLGVDRILTTDSIRHKAVDDRIEVLPIAQLTPVIAAQCTAA